MTPSLLLVLSIACWMAPAVLSASIEDGCLRGESFWCASFDNAVTCSALKHCISKVWQTGEMTSDENKCHNCIIFMQTLKISLHDQESKDSISSKVVQNLCSSFGGHSTLCMATFGEVVEDVLSGLATSNAVSTCQAFDQCGSKFPQSNLTEGNPLCKICKIVIGKVKDAIGSNPTREKVKEELDKVCDKVSSIFKKACKKIIDENVDMLIDLFMDKISPDEICSRIHLCLASFCSNSGDVPTPCETCQIVVSFIDGMTASNFSSGELLRSTLARSCSLMPCKYQEPCLHLKEKSGEELISHFQNKIDQENICSLLNVCHIEQALNFKCIAGPRFWCSSPKNAEICEAENHCKEHYWKL